MIPFDMAVSAVSAQTLALSAKKELAREKNHFVNRPLMISLLWMALLYAPSAMFFYHGWSAWNSVYILRDLGPGGMHPEYPDFGGNRLLWEAILIWIDATLLVGIFYLSFVKAHKWIAADRAKKVVITSVVLGVLLILYWLVTYDRSFVVTTYENWGQLSAQGIGLADIFAWRGFGGATFLGHQVFWANVVVFFIDIGPLFFLYWYLSRQR